MNSHGCKKKATRSILRRYPLPVPPSHNSLSGTLLGYKKSSRLRLSDGRSLRLVLGVQVPSILQRVHAEARKAMVPLLCGTTMEDFERKFAASRIVSNQGKSRCATGKTHHGKGTRVRRGAGGITAYALHVRRSEDNP